MSHSIKDVRTWQQSLNFKTLCELIHYVIIIIDRVSPKVRYFSALLYAFDVAQRIIVKTPLMCAKMPHVLLVSGENSATQCIMVLPSLFNSLSISRLQQQ